MQNLAKLCRGIEDMYQKFHYDDGSAFGHALEGNLHLVFTQGFETPAEVQRYAPLLPRACGARVQALLATCMALELLVVRGEESAVPPVGDPGGRSVNQKHGGQIHRHGFGQTVIRFGAGTRI